MLNFGIFQAILLWKWCVCYVYALEWTRPSFPMGELRTFSSYQVNRVFQGELYNMKVIYLKCYKVFTKPCLFMNGPLA